MTTKNLRSMIAGLAAALCWAAPGAGMGQETTAASDTQAPASEQPTAVRAVVRGFFVEGRVGGGYMVSNAEVKPAPDPAYPQLKAGDKEDLGVGCLVHMALGYDVSENLAIEVLGGATLVSGRRQDKVRDLSVVFGGVGGRLALAMTERVHVLASAGAAYASANNEVESPDAGMAVLGGVGLEYYVHVRHFSVGLELSAFAPVNPFRLFVGLAPRIKYTF